MDLTFYSVFLGTVLSIISLTWLARREHEAGFAGTLSALGGKHDKALQQFRAILWVCGTLFTISVLFFIAPRLDSAFMFSVWLVTYICEVLLGVFPDHKGWQRLWHNIFAYGMALGFLVTAIFFCLRLSGGYQIASWAILAGMLVSVFTTVIDRKRFLYYELSYIYLSHIGICIAALSLR